MTQVKHPSENISVVYEDDAYIVFSKPSGLLVIPTPKKEKYTLSSIVNERFGSKEGAWQLHPCHRLDRETSGLIIFAKGKKNQQLMMDQFRSRQVEKKYIAFVQCRVQRPAGEIKSVIEDLDQKKFSRKPAGKLAITQYKVMEVRKKFSIVEVYPLTGRTNQIRIHFKEIGHPLVGERKYAFGKDFELKFRRVALHAGFLKWYNPSKRTWIKLAVPLPKDMEEFLVQH